MLACMSTAPPRPPLPPFDPPFPVNRTHLGIYTALGEPRLGMLGSPFEVKYEPRNN